MSCCVPRCRNDANYKCPRCDSFYCSVPCYRAHSHSCVQAFSRQASSQLTGITASDTEVARFNALLNRLRRDPHLRLYSEDEPFRSNSNTLEPDQSLSNREDSESDAQEDEEPSDSHSGGENEPHVLEQLMNSLDDEQKTAFFSIFNSAMERAHGSSVLPPEGASQQQARHQSVHSRSQEATSRTHSDISRNISTNRPNEGPHFVSEPQDVGDALEELVHDIEHFDLSYEQILSRLPQQLAQKFHDELNNRSLQQRLKPWRPWWDFSRRDDEDDEEVPEPPQLPKTADLLVSPDIPQRNASTLLINSVIDVLHSICLTLRLYDGDCFSDPFHAARTMWTLSSVLSADARYVTVDQACRACFETTCKTRGKEIAYLALEDVVAVLGGCSDWVARCLFYGQSLLQESRNEVRVSGGRKAVKQRTRKVAYMVAWALCQQSSVFRNTAREARSFVEIERGRYEELQVAKRVVEMVKDCKEVKVPNRG